MKDIIKDNRWFLVPFVVLWMVGLVCQLSFGKADIHLFLNSYHTPFLDTFFKYYTEVGGWIPFAVILVLFLFYNVKSGTVLSATEATATLITAGLKQLFRMPRPKVFFQELTETFPVVEGVRLHSTLSFPSGHTTACFALFFTLALFTKNRWLKLIYFIAALLGAYSRIYLSQHFLEDILAGSIIAVATVIVIGGVLMKRRFGNRSLISYLFCKGQQKQ